jgi:hypothetical protein
MMGVDGCLFSVDIHSRGVPLLDTKEVLEFLCIVIVYVRVQSSGSGLEMISFVLQRSINTIDPIDPVPKRNDVGGVVNCYDLGAITRMDEMVGDGRWRTITDALASSSGENAEASKVSVGRSEDLLITS